MNNTVKDGPCQPTGPNAPHNPSMPGASWINGTERAFRKSPTLRKARRVIVAMFGGTILIIGIALLVLPGPAFVVIPTGLAVLALEFQWARRWLRRIKSMIPGQKKRDDNQPSKPASK